MVAHVAVSSAVYAIDKPYSYRVPDSMELSAGMRVTVPFGRSNRRSEGLVLFLTDEAGTGLKNIECVVDDTPILTESEIRLTAFIRQHYFCTFYDALHAVLPGGVWLLSSLYYEITEKKPDLDQLKINEPPAYNIYSSILDLGGRMSLEAIKKVFDYETESLDSALQYLLNRGAIRSNLDIKKTDRDKTEKIVSLAVPHEEAEKYSLRKKNAAPLQFAVLQFLLSIGSGSSKDICYHTGASMSTLRRLEELGYIKFTVADVFRSPLPSSVPSANEIVLNEEQQTAYNGLLRQFQAEKPGAALLYGVTGSGKTSVYIHLIKRVLAENRSVIFLVPEISLTPQLVVFLMSHFGTDVAVLHSGLKTGERYDEWKRIRNGLARVIIGTRSAVFAPVQNLGLIILDEEQEHTYKSENNPRYHARDVALYRGMKESALVVLGSATPSLETMYKAKSGVYGLFTLSNRYNRRDLPYTELIDMKQEIISGNASSISTPLRRAMEDAFSRDKQCILFLNRRGAGKYRICVSCGNVPSCPRCSVNLTFHLANQRLMCHHCGYSEPAEPYCSCCGGRMKTMGTGTQRVEQELSTIFPDKKVLRMDADAISARCNHEMLLNQFEKQHIPILLGTQMITKGLNFKDVTVVGVLDADQPLYAGNYRSSETTFSMITQVVGRSGRGDSAGKAFVQTMSPDHAVLQLASVQDYDRFYDMELSIRRYLNNPPFTNIFQITIVGLYEDSTYASAGRFRYNLESGMKRQFSADHSYRILGPAPAPILKINNNYRYRVTLCCLNDAEVRNLLAYLLRCFLQDKQNRGITAYIDIDPYD